MSFDGTEGSGVLKTVAAGWTENWRDNHPNDEKGFFFGRDHIEDILDQSGCKGIRVYFGETNEGDLKLILVGADSNENDQIGFGKKILDNGIPCPNQCGEDNDLNS